MIFIILFSVNIVAAEEPVQQIPRARYLEFARASADWTWNHYDSLVADWRKNFDPENIWGYRPPARLLEMAAIYATLYELEGKKAYAEQAKKVLLTFGDYRDIYPEEAIRKRTDYANGVPAFPDFFTTMRYLRAYEILKKKRVLTLSQQTELEKMIAHSIEFTLRTQEWGPMNRTILRAETLAWALRAIDNHPQLRLWQTYEQALAFDNWGNWEIEDAQSYHAVWLYSLLGYADAKNTLPALFATPEIYYYTHYFLNLMCPDGMIPDFGDAAWQSGWNRFLVFFEAAAKSYQNPELKWAASVIGNKFLNFKRIQDTGLAFMLLDCYRFGSDAIKPVRPTLSSAEVMEDVQGKKIVFRTGWQSKSTYLLLNYRDEGDGGRIFRDYLRDTIPVEEEKMTHGHADENSIILLMTNGSVLLHDGGYRDYMPSGPFGAFRQDYFHNRLCVRGEKIWFGQKSGEYRYSPQERPAILGQSVLDFLHNAGSYQPVRTQKIDFLTFEDFDYSRTRLIDDKLGYEWDRVITFLKNPEIFVVFDILKATREGYLTAANLWHTRKIVAQGEHWYDTQYDSLNNGALATNSNLLIYFPKTHYRLEQVEKAKRHYQNEWVISQTTGQYFELTQQVGFVTVLLPHAAQDNPRLWLDRIKFVDSKHTGDGMAVEIEDGNRTIQFGVKADLRMDIVRDYRRPKYTYESGRIVFDKFESNGDFFFLTRTGQKLHYTVVNFTKAIYEQQELFNQPPSLFGLAFDGSPDQPGIGKLRYWRDEVTLK